MKQINRRRRRSVGARRRRRRGWPCFGAVTQHFFPGFVACRRGTPKWAGVKRRGLSALRLRTGSYNRTKQAWGSRWISCTGAVLGMIVLMLGKAEVAKGGRPRLLLSASPFGQICFGPMLLFTFLSFHARCMCALPRPDGHAAHL